MKPGWWQWFGTENNQRTLRLVGGALAGAVVAAWTVYVYMNPTPPSLRNAPAKKDFGIQSAGNHQQTEGDCSPIAGQIGGER